MSMKEVKKEQMKKMLAGIDYQKPKVQVVTEANFSEPAKESAVIACRSLLGT